ncbi:MAG TPA: hypothetical protein VMQ17_00675 [Candidatus Sulfotelmatobacter sp.]|nr:hypothetical protein [Candidatus Sulfotelmatobacter sp.]
MSTMIDVQVRKPFPGLRPFHQGEEHLFFGRESQIHAMIDKLSDARFLAVVGTSGSGKSSLVNCGLRPALHGGLMAKAGTAWRVAQFRPGGNPLRSLACALSKEGVLFNDFDSSTLALVDIIDASLRMSKLGLSRIYHDARLPEDTNLLVVVDQFEELFRYRQIPSAAGDETQQRNQDAVAFVNLLLDAKTHPEIPIYVVLTMRSDFLGDCAEFEGLPEAINEGEYLIPRLTRDERKAAIAGPLGVGGAEVNPVLLTKLLNDVGDNPDQLSILQHALNRTWAYWENEGHCHGPLDLQHYEAIGTMAHALDQHAEKAFRELPGERHRKICEKIFKTLTDRSTDSRGIRRPTKFSVLCKVAEAMPSEVTDVLKVFRKPSRSFVMPPLPEDLEDETIIDISHESLMRIWQRLITWTYEEVQSAQLYRRLAETASLNAEGKEGLWRDPGLQSALDWRAKERPTEAWEELYGGDFSQTMSFLEQSEQQRNREKREKEERRQYELQQAQALAAEREQRLEEQARAGARLGKWLRVLVAASICLICLGLVAGWLGYKASRASMDKDRALADKSNAFDLAQERAREAEAADNEMRLEALRVRDVNLDSQIRLAETADELLKYTDPQLSTRWRLTKAHAYLSVGKYDDSIDLLSRVLDSVPDDFEARTSRGYLQLLRRKTGDGLGDFEYIRDNIDRLSPLNNLNLAVTNAVLGHDAAARASLRAAIDGMHIREYEGGGDSSVPPEITSATGRATLVSIGATFETALYYMRANLESYAGDVPAFEKALAEADGKAQSLSRVAKKDAYFGAMTWAWFECREPEKDCKDYGALASQAALWQRAEFKDWANCYYERFQQQNMRLHDSRYINLANWVKHAKAALGPSRSCSDLKDPDDDVLALEVKAREAEARKDLPEARRLLNDALSNLSKSGPAERNRLLLAKANVLLEIGEQERDAVLADNPRSHMPKSRTALQELEEVCTEILKANPRSSIAHIYYALAESWIDPNSREKVLSELGKSLRLDPSNPEALRLIDQLVPASEPQQSSFLATYRKYLERYYKTSPYQASTLEHEARLAKMDKRYGDALNIVERAIAMDPIDSRDFSLNKLHAEIQQAMGFDLVEVERNLATGYQQARLMRKMRENAHPEEAEAKAWETFAELAKKGPNERLRCNSEVTVCNVTTTIEVHSESVVSGIVELHQEGENVKSLVAKIDRGRDDGVIVGSNGSVWPQYSKGGDGHERALSQLGNAEVLSLNAHSALVRIQPGQPKGDVVRDRDLVMLNARVPLLSDRSSLWSAAKFNITFVDANDRAFFDYGALYSNETPQSDARMLQRMVEDIQHAASAYTDDSKPLEKGGFAGQSLQQALQHCDESNLKKLLDYVVKNSRNRAGKRITLSKEYALWAQNGAPSE